MPPPKEITSMSIDPKIRDLYRSGPGERPSYERLGARYRALIDQGRADLAAADDQAEERRLVRDIDAAYVAAGLARTHDPVIRRLHRQLRAADDADVEIRVPGPIAP